MSIKPDLFTTPYLNDYLAMVEDTESPRIMHVWTALSLISASLGRRCYFPFGSGNILPNQYVLLIGTPGTRKSTAVSLGRRLLRSVTGVRLAPTDTGTARQGLIRAMVGSAEEEEAYKVAVKLATREGTGLLSLAEVKELNTDDIPEEFQVSVADKHSLFAVNGEFTRFIGQNNHQFLDFLTDMWDGEPIEYGTKGDTIQVKNPLLNILSASTPANIAHSLPAIAGGTGFLSRVIMVYGGRRYKSVPRPLPFDSEVEGRVKSAISNAYTLCAGAFVETPEALAKCIELYDERLDITDARFGYYQERRYTHLIKVAMALAASRGSMTILPEDYVESNKILKATEAGMPEALGEFGMNPLAALKQRILEGVRSQGHIVSVSELVMMFHRDASADDISKAMHELINLDYLHVTKNSEGKSMVFAKIKKKDVDSEILQVLADY